MIFLFFSRLYVTSQIRNGDLDEFLKHENQSYPPSPQMGKLRAGKKSDLLRCLEEANSVNNRCLSPTVQVSIVDGAAIVSMLQPATARTFDDYAKCTFIPYVTTQLQNLLTYVMFTDHIA